jgi:hypothetical protein
MSKRTATKPAAKGRPKKRSYAIGKPCTEEEPAAMFPWLPANTFWEEMSELWVPEGGLWFEFRHTRGSAKGRGPRR